MSAHCVLLLIEFTLNEVAVISFGVYFCEGNKQTLKRVGLGLCADELMSKHLSNISSSRTFETDEK